MTCAPIGFICRALAVKGQVTSLFIHPPYGSQSRKGSRGAERQSHVRAWVFVRVCQQGGARAQAAAAALPDAEEEEEEDEVNPYGGVNMRGALNMAGNSPL